MVALVMAAGQSRRFGQDDKRQARLSDGCGVLAASVTHAAEVFDAVRVVLREDDDPTRLGMPPAAHVIRAARAEQGLGASLAEAFAALLKDNQPFEAAAVLLGDMPWVSRATLQTLCDAASASRIVRPRQAGRLGHPVVFGREFWPLLRELRGDVGARALVRQHAERCWSIDVDDAGIHHDIDRPDDLDAGLLERENP